MVTHIANAKTILIFLLFLIPNIVNGQCLLSGTKTIPGDYSTITAAIADLQANGLAGPVILELQVGYNSASETFPITLGAINCASAINTITIRPATGASSLLISSALNASTIDINGGNFWIIDGRAGGSGSANNLTISHTGGGLQGSAIKLFNGASNNVIMYDSLKSNGPFFSTGVVVIDSTNSTGNSNNLIDHCMITGGATAVSPGSNVAQHGIYAKGKTANPNLNNTISNCNIYDCYITANGGTTSSGITIMTGNSDWIIQGNSFYYTTTKTGTIGQATVYGINIQNASGNNFQILNNYFGGNAPLASGSMSLTGLTVYKAINLLVGTTTPTSIQGNTIRSMNINSTLAPPFEGISAANGNYNIGDINGNLIGAPTGTGNITLTNGSAVTSTVESKGININPTVNGVTNISNNRIASITVISPSINFSHGFIAINNKSTSTIISNNIIGSNANFSINASTFSVSGTVQQVAGILVTSNSVTITNNIINHLSNSWVPTTSGVPSMRGIAVSGAGAIDGNIVHDLYSTTLTNSSGINASIIGIQLFGNPTPNNISISRNSIYALHCTSTTAAVSVVGILYNSTTGLGTVARNYIHALTTASATSVLTGIYVANGSATYKNNMIDIGYDTLGNSLTKPCTITGIWEFLNINDYYNNTVYIGGGGVTNSSLSTFAFNSSVTNNSRNIRNNIFINARSNATTGGKHYAIQVGGTGVNPTGLTLDYNIYQVTGTGGVFGRYNSSDVANFNNWRSAVGKDIYSMNVSPCLANPASGFPNLHLTNCSGAGNPADMNGINIGTVVDDFDGDIRSLYTPTDIGADAGNYNGLSFMGNYQNISAIVGDNIQLAPDSAPFNVASFTAKYNPNFTGLLNINPTTGILSFTNVGPVGTYTFVIKSNTNLTQTFTLTVTTANCSRANFKNNGTSATGSGPIQVKVGDFNLDGNQDFVTANFYSNNVTVSMGDGLGGISDTTHYPAGINPTSVAIGDFNNDGNQDLVVTDSVGTVIILLGSISGTFSYASTVNVGALANSVAVGEFNSDGISDIAVTNEFDNSVSIIRGNVNATFSVDTVFLVSSQPESIALGDFNNDGKTDIAVATNSGNVSIRMGTGTGNFIGTTEIMIAAGIRSIAVGDFNANGNVDFAVTNGNYLYSYLGNGSGGFSGSFSYYLNSTNANVTVGNFNNDVYADVAVSITDKNQILTGFGSSTALTSIVSTLDVETFPHGIAAGDFNNDGIQDLVTTFPYSDKINISLGRNYGVKVTGNNKPVENGSITPSLLNNTDFGLVPVPSSPTKYFLIRNNGSTNLTINSITFTGTNASDFVLTAIVFPHTVIPNQIDTFYVTCNLSTVGMRTATVHINYSDCASGDYNFAIQANGVIPILYSYPNTSVTAAGNVTVIPSSVPVGVNVLTAKASPGFMGAISADPVTGKIYISNAQPAGTYTITVYPVVTGTQTFTLTVTNPACSYADFTTTYNQFLDVKSTVAIADLNKDGIQDLVSNSVIYGIEIYFGTGLGGFSYSQSIWENSQEITSIVTADFNGDGNLDIAASSKISGYVYLNFGDASGYFGSLMSYTAIQIGGGPVYLVTNDFNNDGKPDLAFANSTNNNINIRLGNGAGGFTSAADVSVGTSPAMIVAGNFNGDNFPDLATVNVGSQNVSIRLGNGSGGFTGTTTISLPYINPEHIAIGDFNTDGKQDFAITYQNFQHNVSIRYGDGFGNFTGTTDLLGIFPKGIVTGDYNGDGKQDLALASDGYAGMNFFINNGAGGFNSLTNINNTYSKEIAMGDFNNDSIQDLIAISSGPNTSNTLILIGNNPSAFSVHGNGNLISDGSTTVSLLDNTDFGVAPTGNSLSKEFYIVNKSAAPITINSITIAGANAAEFSLFGITFPRTVLGDDSAIFNIICTPASLGIKNATIHVSSSGCQVFDYDFVVQANAVTPTLGNYSPLTIIAGGNGTTTPSAAPVNTPVLYATTSSKFKGVITADPVTGVVKIVDAKPAGTYTVTIKIGTASKTFTLTVVNPNCSQAAFESTNPGVINYSGNNSMSIGDFNSDGIQDLIVANNSFDEIIAYTGNGSGGFTASIYAQIQHPANSLAVGDINGDGKQDVVMADSTTNQASAIIGDVLGGFVTLPSNYTYNPFVSVGSRPVCVTLADFNGDNKLDLATANYLSNSVSVRLGDGSGHFSGSTEVNVGTGPNYIATGDFNGDGKVDFATTNYSSNTVSIRLGNGTGGFTGSTNIIVGANPNCITLADFNNDGKTDFATSNGVDPNNTNISVSLGNGSGGFGAASTIAVSWPITAMSITSGDFNGDGKQDFVVQPGDFSATAGVYMGNGNGTFATVNLVNVSNGTGGIAIGDFNSDGLEDIAVGNRYDMSILMGKLHGINVLGNNILIPDGSLLPSQSLNTDFGLVPNAYPTSRAFTIKNSGATAFTVSSITLTGTNQSDFSISGITLPVTIGAGVVKSFKVTCNSAVNGNKIAFVHVNYTECTVGDYDFEIIANVVTPTLGNYANTTVSSCGNVTIIPTSAPANVQNLYVTTSSAFKGIIETNPITGNVSIVNANPAGTYTMVVRSGNVSKTFVLTVSVPVCSPGTFSPGQNVVLGNYPKIITMGDFNGDGNQDIAATSSYFTEGYIAVSFGDGQGGFSGNISTLIHNEDIYDITVADFNNDGKDDIAFVGGYLTPTFQVRYGQGNGTFNGVNGFPVGSYPTKIATGDFNNDGKVDIVVSCQNANLVSVWLGDGVGSFNSSTDITASSPSEVGIADFNGDGNADLAIPSLGTSIVSIKLGNGTGTFSGSTTVTVSGDPMSLKTGDFNNDGKQDFITGNINGLSPANYSVRLGNGLGGFTGSTNVTLPYGPYVMQVGDFNGDGFLDFAALTPSNTNLVTFRYGNGTGTFTGTLVIPESEFIFNLVVGDFNEDKIEDYAVVLNSGDPTIGASIHYGQSSEINVEGNGNTIPDGSVTITSSNNTDFGTVSTASPVTLSYVIQNTGSLPLTINSITKTGANTGDFVVSGITFPKTISADTMITFSITFTPQAGGIRSAVIHINNTDCNEGDYDFAVQGIYCVPPVFTACPTNQSITAPSGFCGAVVSYVATVSGVPTPAFSTTFSGATTGNVSTNGSGTLFNPGTTHVVIMATNACGSTTCAFDVHVTVISQVDDNNVCTTDNCNSQTGAITHININTNDNNACTDDGCHSVTGVFHNPVNINDNDSCTVDGCITSSGVFHNPVNTNDNNLCTTDGCHSVNGVFHNPVNTNDNNACTSDGCISSSGIYHNPVSVDDQNVCTDDGCISTSGVYHNTINIDDGNACTDDACHSITGVSHTPVLTDDNDIYTLDGCDSITGVYHHPIFTLKVFIEGYYSGNGLMDNYGAGGCLKVTHLSSNYTDVDTLYLTLVDSATLLPVASSKAILQTNGYAEFIFSSAIPGNVYLKVNQRNSIETWSSVSLSLTAHSYDFTLNANQAYGNNMVDVFDHYGYAFYSGDICNSANQPGVQDGIVNNHDYLLVEQGVYNTYLGYVVGDLTGDGMVESSDYVLIQNNWYYNYVVMKP